MNHQSFGLDGNSRRAAVTARSGFADKTAPTSPRRPTQSRRGASVALILLIIASALSLAAPDAAVADTWTDCREMVFEIRVNTGCAGYVASGYTGLGPSAESVGASFLADAAQNMTPTTTVGSLVGAVVYGKSKLQLAPLCAPKGPSCLAEVTVGGLSRDASMATTTEGNFVPYTSATMDMQSRGHGDEVRGKANWFVSVETTEAKNNHLGDEAAYEYLGIGQVTDIVAAPGKELKVTQAATRPAFDGALIRSRLPVGDGTVSSPASMNVGVGWKRGGVDVGLGGSWSFAKGSWSAVSDGNGYTHQFSSRWGDCYLPLDSNVIWRIPNGAPWKFNIDVAWAVDRGGC